MAQLLPPRREDAKNRQVLSVRPGFKNCTLILDAENPLPADRKTLRHSSCLRGGLAVVDWVKYGFGVKPLISEKVGKNHTRLARSSGCSLQPECSTPTTTRRHGE